MAHTQDGRPSTESPGRRALLGELNRQFAMALHNDWREFNQAQGKKVRGRPGRRYGAYRGGYLSWPHLAELIADRLSESQISQRWQPEEVQAVIEKADRRPPDDPLDRQLFLEAVDRALEDCHQARIAVDPSAEAGWTPPRYMVHFLGSEPQVVPFRPFDFDPESIGFFEIIDWNAGRQLGLENVAVPEKVQRFAGQDWVDEADLARHRRLHQVNPGGPCPTLASYELPTTTEVSHLHTYIEDTRETANDTLRLSVSKSVYYEHIAIAELMHSDEAIYPQVVARIKGHGTRSGARLANVIKGSPNSNIVINVTVTDRDGDVMLLKRHQNARVWAEYFQAGPHETMNWRANGEQAETCFELAQRALWEEVGISDPADYHDRIVFSWFGFYLPDASTYFFSHVRTRLTKNELIESVQRAPGKWEFSDVDWLTPSAAKIRAILRTWANGPWSPATDDDGRLYLPHTTMSLTQLHRVTRQGMLDV
jgi:8-oxo-dGTP pyrophosphatase MutT (NUDIX family)